MNSKPRSLFLDEQDQGPSEFFRSTPMPPKVMLAGLGTTAVCHLLIPIWVMVIGIISPDNHADVETEPAIVEELVIQARFAQLGVELPPDQLPNREVPRLSTTPPEIPDVPTIETPREVAPERPERREEPPPDAVEDLIQRLGDRAQAFAEIAEEREREGSEEGVEGGDQQAEAGNAYIGRLAMFFHRGWHVPQTIDREALGTMRATASVQIGQDLSIVSFSILRSSENAEFDQSVLDQLLRLQTTDGRIPPPPEEVATNYIGRTRPIEFRGRNAR